MNLIQTIFHTHADEFMKRHPVDQHTAKVIRAIQRCRTGDCGYHQYACPSCGAGHVAASSCGNRHCNRYRYFDLWCQWQSDSRG